MNQLQTTFSLGKDNNRAIRASAGSGKTFQLAMRFIAILAIEPRLDPAQIVAITFTRKAAAEILAKITDQLLAMEKDPTLLAERIAQGLLPPELKHEDIPTLLARILASRELQISTIDSFFVRIIEAFAPEFGLSGAVEMIDESRDTGERETIAGVIRSEKEHLLPLLKEYALGSDARNFTETLKRFLSENYGIYLIYPEEALWGNLPEEQDDLTDAQKEKIITTLEIALEHYNYPPSIEMRVRELIRAARGEKVKDLQAFPDVYGEGIDKVFRFSRKEYPVSAETADGIERLSHHVAVAEWRKKVAKSRAAYRLLKLYDTLYAANVRGAGRLAFRDLPKLLGELGEEEKLDLEYRMDSRNRHYMLDEFQDTSAQQWNFMHNLMAEAIQSTDQSFFMVGDVKQSLYQWRLGNPRLFDAITDFYDMETRRSDRSFRSAPAVIETVNRVFGDPERVPERDQEAVRRMNFSAHETAKDSLAGYAALIQLGKESGKPERAAEIVNTIRTVQPLERALSVAVLVRTNKEVEEYKQLLRQLCDYPVTTEGATSTSESMACTFLALLLRYAAHPGDELAGKALPLFAWQGAAPFAPGELAGRLGLSASSWHTLAGALRELLTQSGIRGVVQRFGEAFRQELSAFDRERLAIMEFQAEEFSGSVDDYLASLDKAQGVGASTQRTIQIMTIHKSKGLEFDAVFLPELGYLPGGGGARLVVAPTNGEDENRPDFVSYLPGGFAERFLPSVAEINEKLHADALYEKCCSLYVALTRAKRALYMFVSNDRGSEGTSFRADQLLASALCREPDPEELVIYADGNARWFESVEAPEPAAEMSPIPLGALTVKAPRSRAWHSPSREVAEGEVAGIPPDLRFEPSRAAEIGSRIHAMLEAVEFLGEENTSKVRAMAGNDELTQAVFQLWERISAPEGAIAAVLRRPAQPVELWRERDFLIAADSGELFAGCFDRVQIVRDASGKAESAVIFDYKSDALSTPEEFITRHQAQLEAYRTALAKMLALPEAKIECVILALRPNAVIPCAAVRK